MLEQLNYSFKENKLAISWIALIYICVLWTCFEAPLSYVLSKQLKEHNLWWDGLFSLIFFTDIFLRVKGKLSLSQENRYSLLAEQKHNQKPYFLSKWFYIDLLTSLPFDIIASVFGLHIVSNTIVSIRLLRVIRILKLRSIIKVSEFLPRSLKITLILSAVLLAIHWIACGWMLISPRPDLDIISFYNVSLYWAISTLTTIGYGDITPTTNIGRVYTMVVMIIGVAGYGVIIGNFSRLIMLADKYKEEKKEKMTALLQFMKYYNIPRGLQQQTFKFYKHLLEQNATYEEEKIVNNLPKALQNELALYKKIKLIRNVHIFKNCTTPCLKMIAMKLKQTVHSPNELIMKKGELGLEMFIIGHGEFEVIDGDQTIAVLKDGQFFGELALMHEIERSNDVVSRSYSELYCLYKEDFFEIIEAYPNLEESFSKKYYKRKDDPERKKLKLA